MFQKQIEMLRQLDLPPVQLFHNNNELLEKLSDHKMRGKVWVVESYYNMDK